MRSSSSHRAPISPPRFMVPNASLPSSAPSSASSSSTSGLPSTPSTPGWANAVTRAPSSRRRSAITKGSDPTPSMPRAVWSAATMNSRPSRSSGRRARACSAARAARGSAARRSIRSVHWESVSGMVGPSAGPRSRRDRACRQRTSDGRPRWLRRRCRSAAHAGEIPARQQAVAERAAEGVAGA